LQKMALENFSIDAFYNITKNQDNPIKTVGQDSFLSPKTPKKYSAQTTKNKSLTAIMRQLSNVRNLVSIFPRNVGNVCLLRNLPMLTMLRTLLTLYEGGNHA